MKKASIVFLQMVVVLIGLGALVLLILEPRMEGVNAHATTLSEIYFDDPFLLLMYAGSIPFFIALYQAIKILRYIQQNNVFSVEAVKSLRIVKYCALAIIGFVVVEETAVILNHGNDDAAGAIMLGLVIVFISAVIATVTRVFEKTVQRTIDLKSENNLT